MLKENLHNAIDNWSNSFVRPHIPPKLMSNSTIKRTEDDGAKLIYAKFMYGEKTGKYQTKPFDGSYGNVIQNIEEESLWIYSLDREKIPTGFVSQKSDGGYIETGKVQKCPTCRGQGRVPCKSCGGKVRWTEKFGDKVVDKVCSCGDGKQTCGECTGYGDVETIIVVKNNFRLFETKNSQYNGEVPENKIKSITGESIFEHTIEYPIDELRNMLKGGLDSNEFNQLNNYVLEELHDKVNTELSDKGVNTKLIHEQINTLFQSVPNAGKENKLLEKEVIPIRVLLRVEDAPVTQVDYTFKEKDYSLWVFGNENKVWHQGAPFSFNYKMIILTVLLLGIIGFAIFNSMGGHFSSMNSTPSPVVIVQQSTIQEPTTNNTSENSNKVSTEGNVSQQQEVANTNSLTIVHPENISANGNLLPSGNLTYYASNVDDDNLSTWWTPSPKSDGTNSWLKLDFTESKNIGAIEILNGSHYENYPGYGDLYLKNNRLIKADLEFSGGEKVQINLDEIDQIQRKTFTPVQTSYIILKPIEWVNGSQWKDLSISYFKAMELPK